jgi:predicted TIM-barrel fold metal-dependent hydrolase
MSDAVPMPTDIGIIDLMMGMPSPRDELARKYDFLKANFKDVESREEFEFPAEYMFKDVPKYDDVDDPVEFLLAEMDRFGIEKSVINVAENEDAQRALRDHGDRFLGSVYVSPTNGMESVRHLERAVHEHGATSAQTFPAGLTPPVPVDDKRFYPVYAKLVELDIPIFVTVGVPGPRIPFSPQDVARLDEVCWFFPELKIIMRHGAEPWTDLAVKLMLKWPNLYYSTSAFAPKHYPADIVDYANTRGADKIMYGGYYPAGLSLDRIFAELPNVGFRDHVWPKFLRENALRVFGLDT